MPSKPTQIVINRINSDDDSLHRVAGLNADGTVRWCHVFTLIRQGDSQVHDPALPNEADQAMTFTTLQAARRFINEHDLTADDSPRGIRTFEVRVYAPEVERTL